MTGTQSYEVIDEDAAARATSVQEMAYEVLVGLSSRPKSLPSRYFYDDRGSELFRAIMDLDEYYLTSSEHQILEQHAGDIVAEFDGPMDIVDLGAGDGAKTRLILKQAAREGVTYIPVDISQGAMASLVDSLGREMPELEVRGLVGGYIGALRWLSENRRGRPRLVLFLGSNIGNFNQAQARGFVSRIWTHLEPQDRLVVGFDLKKDIERLLLAYNDPGGVTAAFNLNLLTRLNRELGASFDLSCFRHYGTYDVMSGAMESYLVSLENQSVFVEHIQRSFEFRAWEPIHTEYSYKYLRSDVDALASDCGFEVRHRFGDVRGWFIDDVWAPSKV